MSKLGATPDVKPVDLPAHPIVPAGKLKVETWNNLQAGNYILSTDPIAQVPECRWAGDASRRAIRALTARSPGRGPEQRLSLDSVSGRQGMGGL